MGTAVQLNFAHRFHGRIWNLLASESMLLAELRDKDAKEVSFSLLNTANGEFIWQNRVLDEKWWVTASAICGEDLLFTVYMDTNNPDKKGLVVCGAEDLSMRWWKNDFSLSDVGTAFIRGFTSRLGLKQVVLRMDTGDEAEESDFDGKAPSPWLSKPVQYLDGTENFNTVQRFLVDRLNFQAVSSLEYLEARDAIIISCYTGDSDGLANYLFVLSVEGNVLLKEKLDGPVKGIGLDTFFLLHGCVIFVRNKVELVSFRIL